MAAVSLEVKKRCWQKKYDEAPEIECACGCGGIIKSVDKYGRPKSYINGHNNRKYDRDDRWAIQKAWLKRNREWVRAWRQKNSRQRKVALIEYLGGICAICGSEYNGTNGASFHFHHIDPSTKSFGIGNNLTNRSMDDLMSEVDKCILLCSNCHRIEHNGEY